jgi:2-oxoglutarate ferredoxin oxidoreductase subunit beta
MVQIESVHGVEIAERHPMDELLRPEKLPHTWCAGCGLGIFTKCLVESIGGSRIPLDKHAIVSGVGCTSRLLDYLDLATYRTTRGRAIPFATGLKIAKPELEVTVIEDVSELFNIGDNHLIHAIRRNVDLNVFCVDNFNYAMTGDQFAANTPIDAEGAITPYDKLEAPFNAPYLVAAAGAPFVSRWTTIHIRQLFKATQRAFQVQGLAFLEIVTPCSPTFDESNNFEDAHAQMEYFRNCSRVDDHADLSTIGLSMKPPEPIVVGNFVDQRKPTYHEMEQAMIDKGVERKSVS